jgi:outer membrane receptor protein involved in Fe transport
MKKSTAPFFLFPFFICTFYSIFSHAQVTGSVADSTRQPLPFCTVMLIKTSDSAVVTGTSTNEKGEFLLEKKDSGSFRLLVLFSGYEKYYSSSFLLSDTQPKYDAGKITLLANSKVLNTAEIVAQKPFMEQQLDRTVFNIENSVLSSGNNALDVLKKLPGVTVDNNDNVSVRGKSGVLFMIDGRTSYLSGSDIANYLRSIDASQIEKIEVITNPSAKYDASGNAIINIVLKKNKNLGFNGQLSVNYGQGFYYESNDGINANYRMKKWNFFGAENYGFGEYCVTRTSTTIYSANAIPQETFINRERFVNVMQSNFAKAGVDFTPNNKQTIGFVAEGNVFHVNQNRTFASGIYNANSDLDSSLFTNSHHNWDSRFITYDLNYKFNIDTTGKELSADINYAPFFDVVKRENITYYYDNANQPSRTSTTLNANLPRTVNILAGKIDYVQPIGKKTKMETGVKSSFVSTDNNAEYFNVVQGVEIPDTTLTNHFLYMEKIYSAYVNYIGEINKKLDFQLGFRGEETQSKGTQLANDSAFNRNYFNLFPSTFLNWKIDSTHTLNFSYSKRIDRPDYNGLNPFMYFVNPLTFSVGNPYLRPQMSDNFELTHVFKDVFSTSIGYMHMQDVFTQIPYQNDSTHISFTRDENFSTYNTYNATCSITLPVTNWFTTVSYVTVFHDHYFGSVADENFSTSGFTWQFSTLNTISLKKNWSIELYFFYRGLNRDGAWMQLPLENLDAGIKKNFANRRGTFALEYSDILLRTYLNGTAIYPGVNTKTDGHADSRRLYLSVSWKLGKSQYRRDEQQKSADDELKRTK